MSDSFWDFVREAKLRVFRRYIVRDLEFDLGLWSGEVPEINMAELEWDLAEWENEKLLATWEDELDAWIDETGRVGPCPADPRYRPWPKMPASREHSPGDETIDEFLIELRDDESRSDGLE